MGVHSKYCKFCKDFSIGEEVLYYGEPYIILDINDTENGFDQCLLGINKNKKPHTKQWMYNHGIEKVCKEEEEKRKFYLNPRCKNCLSDSVCIEDIDAYGGCQHFKDKDLYLKLPCKIGDIVYTVSYRTDDFSGRKYPVLWTSYFSIDMFKNIGKTIFLTEKEAQSFINKLDIKEF